MSEELELDTASSDTAAHVIGAMPVRTDDPTSTIVRSLQARLGNRFDAPTLAAEVEAEFGTFAGMRITQFVPIFVERRVAERLSRATPSLHDAEGTLR